MMRAMEHDIARHRHPVFRIVMVDEGRSLVWLARQIGMSHAHVKAVSAGIERPSARFRAECARVLGRPEADLFHGGAAPSESTQPEGTPDFGSTSSRSHRGLPERTDAPEEVAIGIPA